ncbi:MAG: hypothetical protein COV74_05770 [Candidatus Omnitrophica bacterium CG11_big_fil_rev_8_21_14_0_20_45_26]|uniref:Uncharacterized protein n=1 Tax=Candidatus Abzuiibacterium crystallinum TaxID=1974748 RepID=A0A2H0LP22_9BACT|nr:MAG: hypothetical protein COV74_05770 [Candidatus Omnitrophica bacterium CG11_big_fil_rev_8_21_14_0_20_45_26]PIW64077.1 MAG: hypothetical protein COW12_07505 [Candidatus Omnitrophica bacterium CG12_big_fil_rev_8_21_14_0_65_45_16]
MDEETKIFADYLGNSENEYGPDSKTQQVKKIIVAQLENDKSRVYFQRQLEVLYEKKFFHWVTGRAIKELKEEGRITVDYYPIQVRSHRDYIKIITHKKNRYYRTRAKQIASLVEMYSNPSITSDTGFVAEELFKVAYAEHQFSLIATHTNKLRGKQWVKTNHDVDFIVEKKGKFFGCEVKNTLGYIDREDMDIKIELCQFLGIMPIFIVRYSPTVWNNEVFENGGLVQVFETQIFSPGKAELVGRLKNELELPVLVSRRIPDSIMDRLDRVLETRVFKV